MLGLNGKEFERDNRFSDSLPVSVEKADTEATTSPVQRKKSFITRFLERYRKLPLLSRIVSILASLWIIFATMRFVHQGFARRGRHGSRNHGWDGAPCEEPVPIAISFNPTVHIGTEELESKTSLPLYLQPFQALELSWDQGVKGALSIQEDDTNLQQPYIVLQTTDDEEFSPQSSVVEAFAVSDRLSIRFKASESVEAAEKIYNVILRVPAYSDTMPPIILRGAEASLNIPEDMEEAIFPLLEIDSLLSGFRAGNLRVGLLRISSGTGDITGTFNVSHELDLKTSTGNITAKVNLHPPSFPHLPHHKPGKHHKHPKHDHETPPFGKRWFWQSNEDDVKAADRQHRPGPPEDHHGRLPPPPDHRGHPPFPPHRGDRRPPFPPGPDHHRHHPGHPPPFVRVRALSSTGNIHLTYLNHLEKAALISTVYSDTGNIEVKLAEEYKGRFKAEVKVGQVVLANERDKTVTIDREIKTPTGAFVEGFVRSGNDTDSPDMLKDFQPEGDERLAVEREFDFARMTSQGPPLPFPHGPNPPPHRGGRHGPHRGPGGPMRGRPHGPPHGPPHGHPSGLPLHPPPPPGFGFCAAFSTVGEVRLFI